MPPSMNLSATYRLQFNKHFTFRDAAEIVDYLWALGITHIYASPLLASRRGSTHGYDAIDPTKLNPELSTEADFIHLQDKLRERGMGLVLDIVPNHMSASSENSWWMDVLENGPESAYASYFDIDWQPPARRLEGKVLLPVLGRPFAEVLEAGELSLRFLDGKFYVQYFESLFPVAPETYRKILKHRIDELRTILKGESPAYQEFSGIVAAATALSEPTNQNNQSAGDQRLRFEGVKQRLRELASGNAYVHTFLQRNLKDFAGSRGNPASFSGLERLLAEQHYVLAYWQNVNEEINYRRFFTINDLVGMRMQDPLVFEATHSLILRLVEQGSVQGLRIDHIDGLRNPVAYLNILSERLNSFAASRHGTRTPIYVEKILAHDEVLPTDWPVAGTTGYDFLNALNCAFVDPRVGAKLEKIYSTFLGKDLVYSDLLYHKKRLVMATLLAVEMRALGHQLEILAADDRYARDIPRVELDRALVETTAHLSVYRTYARNLELSSEDTFRITQALSDAQARRKDLNAESVRFLGDVLLVLNRPYLQPGQREARLAFLIRWQQFTGPIMAKAFEDTFLYVYHPLTSLNDVGGEPRPSIASSSDFSSFIVERAKNWPHSLNTTTTHDTKRSEDVRARISVLSEIPELWELRLRQWTKWNARHRKMIDGRPVPDPNEELFLYQTLLGIWPVRSDSLALTSERLQQYAIKATREAMVHTRWTLPNLNHENALCSFVRRILTSTQQNRFLRDFVAFHGRIAVFGMLNSLTQSLWKIAAPGIPDFYQGSELWDLRLVDPHNRQPVDFVRRNELLSELEQAPANPADLLTNWQDARIKLWTISKSLNYRRQHAELFTDGKFVPLVAQGKRKRNVTAFARIQKREWAFAIAPRWLANEVPSIKTGEFSRFWGTTKLRLPAGAPRELTNVLTGEILKVPGHDNRPLLAIRNVFAQLPVALLTGNSSLQATATRSRKRHSKPR